MSTDGRLDDPKEAIADSRYPQFSAFLNGIKRDASSCFNLGLSGGKSVCLSVRHYDRGEGLRRDAFIVELPVNRGLLRVECHVSDNGNIVITRAGTKGGLDLLERIASHRTSMTADPSFFQLTSSLGADDPKEEPTVTVEVTGAIRRALGIEG